MWIVYGFIVFCAVRLAVFLNARLKRAAAANITYGDMRFRVLSRVFLYPVRQLAWQGLFFDNTYPRTLQVAYVIVWFPTSVARAESLLNPEMKGIDVVTLNSAATLCLQLAGFINFGIFLYVDCACRLPHTRLCALHTRPCVSHHVCSFCNASKLPWCQRGADRARRGGGMANGAGSRSPDAGLRDSTAEAVARAASRGAVHSSSASTEVEMGPGPGTSARDDNASDDRPILRGYTSVTNPLNQ